MPDLWMDVDAALAEVPVNIFPLIDDTDFKSIEGAVAYNAAGMALRWHFVTCAGAYTVTSVTPTTGGNYDWTDQGDSGIYTIEIPASGGASINNDTEGFGWFTGVATGVLPWRGPVIGFRAAGLNDLLIDSAYSTTRGLAGTALPAAAADAAGGLPISDAGGLDLDAQVVTKINSILDDTGTAGVVVASIANNAITAAAIATGAIDADAIADNAIDAGAIATGAITAAKFAAGAIDAAAIANGAIDAATFAADVDAEAAAWIWNAAMASFGGAGTYGQALEDTIEDTGTTLPGTLAAIAGYIDTEVAAILAAVDTEVAAILADTNELQTDLANGGRLDLLIDAIKAKTDSLTFTVAGNVDANIQRINDVALTGDGSATPWGPA